MSQHGSLVISHESGGCFIIGAVDASRRTDSEIEDLMQASGQWLKARATVNLEHAR